MNDIEKQAHNVLSSFGLTCFSDLGHVQISRVCPDDSISLDHHFEFDYFVLFSDWCFVGEITDRSNESDVRKKYKKFCSNFDRLKNAFNENGQEVFKNFDVPEEKRELFDQVRKLRAFVILTQFEKFDIKISEVANAPIIYKVDWEILKSYSKSIARFAKYPFLKMIGIDDVESTGHLIIRPDEKYNLISLENKIVASNNVSANVYTFTITPAELLETAEVFRRELIPLIKTSDTSYQRQLEVEKLRSMRKLVSDPSFMFPNSILVALDEKCMFDQKKNRLEIPRKYGSVSIIDGQHRLFSYANPEFEETRKNAKILVTAIKFKTDQNDEFVRCSAKTFVEINKNQTRISSTHINEIAYTILGENYPKAISAQVILRANQESENPLHGIFISNLTTKGKIKAATVITHLARLTDLTRIEKLNFGNSNSRSARFKRGYKNLFDLNFDELDGESLITHGKMCLIRFFRYVKSTFPADWPERGMNKSTTLEYTKVFAAFVRLLDKFLREGLNWDEVRMQLDNIRTNVIKLREANIDDNDCVFAKSDENIPNEGHTIVESLKFLDRNRETPTSILDIVKQSE